MISIPLISGLLTVPCRKRMLTVPSLTMSKARIVPMSWPTCIVRSMSSMTLTPSRSTSKIRSPTWSVDVARLARYRRTWIGVPAATGKFHCISLPPVGSLRSVVQSAGRRTVEVALGTVASLRGVARLSGAVAVVLPVLRNGRRAGRVGRPVGAVVDRRQQRPAGVDAVEHRGVAVPVVPVDAAEQEDVVGQRHRCRWPAPRCRPPTGRTPAAGAARCSTGRCRCRPRCPAR